MSDDDALVEKSGGRGLDIAVEVETEICKRLADPDADIHRHDFNVKDELQTHGPDFNPIASV